MRKNKCPLWKGALSWFSLTVGLMMMLFSHQISGQCTLACVTEQANAAVDQDCIATITRQMIIPNDSTNCTGPFEITVLSMSGDTLVTGTEFVMLPSMDLIGDIVLVVLQDSASGQSCVRPTLIEDNLPPTLSCPMDTVACTASLDTSDLKMPVFTDNCDQNVTLTFSDIGGYGPECDSIPFIGKVERQWVAMDSSGNSDTCIQMIFLEKPDTLLIEFPGDGPFDCGISSLDPDITGWPTIDGNPIDTGGFCQMTPIFTDSPVVPLTNCGVRYLRSWQVIDHCTGAIIEDTQILRVEDTEDPEIVCASLFMQSTDEDTCVATVLLPPPVSISDNCGPWVITVHNPFDNIEQPLNQSYIATLGMHTVLYIVRDECLNADTCEMSVEIIDTQTPTAICDQITSVSVTTTGTAIVPAFNFDDGSFDNCGPVDFLASRDGLNFAPTVTFDCADVGDTIVVTVRVREVANSNSFSDCVVEVEVEDKLPPVFLTCPPDISVDCEADFSNLANFGLPTVFDNCGATVTSDSTFNIGVCETGTIVRTFTAVDESGNAAFPCSQTITVENQTPFDGSTILWPLDTTVFDTCPAPSNFDPDNLLPGYDWPVVTNANCAMIAKSYANQIFDDDLPACYKIVRHWALIDWCEYDPGNPPTGKWTHQQIIQIMDNVPPEITFCPTSQVVGIDDNCEFAMVDLAPLTVNDCNNEITITNNSLYAQSNGANASGIYPMGTHDITFDVTDGCGNESSCSLTISVVDNKLPTPLCDFGIVGELQLMGGDGMIVIEANLFDEGSFDNCTAPADLEFFIQLVADSLPGPPTTTELVFTCDDIGMHEVEIWVTDEAGNSDYCTTVMFIQDNMEVCDDPSIASISGEIQNEMGDDIEEVTVHMEGTNAFPDTTGFGGSFAFPNLPIGYNYTITPEKDIYPDNGVTTFDMVLITRHVLGVKLLDSPFKIIAADVNNSGTVTTFDVVELRKLILKIYDDFPQNTSWRFVEKSHQFLDEMNPFFPPFPEVLNVNNFTQDELEANFTGVKTGDVNNSAVPNSLVATGDRSELDDLVFMIENQEVRKGKEFEINFRIKESQSLLGWQFTIDFDVNALRFVDFEKGLLESLTEENFGWSYLEDGILTVSWFDLKSVGLDEKSNLFRLRFQSNTDGMLDDFLSINSRYTHAEAYDENEEVLNVKLEYENGSQFNPNSSFELFQNQPNPFKKETLIGFKLPEAGQARLTIYDVSGKELKTLDRQFSKGYNELSIDKNELNGSGVLYYQLETPTHTATRKMILLQ